MRSAPETFERKSDAQRYLSIVEAQMAHGEWMDPKRAQIRLQDYTERWVAHRANLRPRTVELYRWVLKRHVTPYLGGVPLSRLDTPMVREWRASLLASGVSPNAAAKAYRLLRAVLMTAVNEDRILPRNPCRIPGADREAPAERPVLALPQVIELADLVPRRYRAMILVATFASLRYGEAIALRRVDVNVERMSIRVVQAYTEVRGRGMVLGPPKSRAGVRTIAVPAFVADALREHLTKFVLDEVRALVFTGPKGAPLRRGNFNKLVGWAEAV